MFSILTECYAVEKPVNSLWIHLYRLTLHGGDKLVIPKSTPVIVIGLLYK
jgi:hypothetical protein